MPRQKELSEDLQQRFLIHLSTIMEMIYQWRQFGKWTPGQNDSQSTTDTQRDR